MAAARAFHTETLLQNGKILVVGGYDGTYLASAELYDPATRAWSTAGTPVARAYHTAVLLRNGKVLVAGGSDSSGALNSAELYDPTTNSWSSANSLNVPRFSHTATLLNDGRVLVAGGSNGADLNTAELYDPSTNIWNFTGTSMSAVRSNHTATLLTNGKVLVVGGGSTDSSLLSAELYDPSSNSWNSTAGMTIRRTLHAAVLLTNGKVLVAGGFQSPGTSVIYDPSVPSWTASGPLNTARYSFAATLLPSGKVLVEGGVPATNTVEIFDPAGNGGVGSWTLNPSMSWSLSDHAATLLWNGDVIVTGGTTSGVYLPSVAKYNYAATTWSATGGATGTADHIAVLLSNGKVLKSGGSCTGLCFGAVVGAQLYDPGAGGWSATGNMKAARKAHRAVLLANGKVLVAGGQGANSGPNVFLSSAELYDPAPGTWAFTGSMNVARIAPTLTLLNNGKVLVAGGTSAAGSITNTAELYDSQTGTWTFTGNMNSPRSGHRAVLLPDGRVFVASGGTASGFLSSSEIYDPGTGIWTPTASYTTARGDTVLLLLPNGKVMMAGGNDGTNSMSEVLLYDPAGDSWSTAVPLSVARRFHAGIVRLDGSVLICGGWTGSISIQSCESYDQTTGFWTLSFMPSAHDSFTLTQLPDGRALAAAGDLNGTLTGVSAVGDPGLGFNTAWRPQITSAVSPFYPTDGLSLSGSGFQGISEASGGVGHASSATDYPLVRLQSLGNNHSTWLKPGTDWTSTTFQSASLSSFSYGYALATLFANGIPSVSYIVRVTNSKVSVTSNINPSCPSQSITLTATVDPSAATGSVSFYDGVTLLGTQPLSGGTAALSTSSLSVGSHSLTAVYSGDSTHDSSTSIANTQVVNSAPSAPSVSGSTPLCESQSIYLNASTVIGATYFWTGPAGFTSSQQNPVIPSAVTADSGAYSVTATVDGCASGVSSVNINVVSCGSATWSGLNPMTTARSFHTATLLQNNKVLVVGGSTAQLYDPSTGAWSASHNFGVSLTDHTATLLENGKVLIAGGAGSLPFGFLYDPTTDNWNSTLNMNAGRGYHTATLLNDGRVLIAGGVAGASTPTATAEIYDPSNGNWSLTTNSMSAARFTHTATLLSDGRVLVTGGDGAGSADLFNPVTGLWSATSSMHELRFAHTATLLPTGTVMVAGGNSGNTSEVYNPSSATWSYAGNTSGSRREFSATLLPDGKVLIDGGEAFDLSILNSAELFDPSTGSWTGESSMVSPRRGHTATLLPGGRVMITGGDNGGNLSSVELYDSRGRLTTAGGAMNHARRLHTLTLLSDGRVLAAGGENSGALATSERYDPATGTWTDAGLLTEARHDHRASLLPDGKVLVTGGYSVSSPFPVALSSAEVFNPAGAGTWSSAGSLYEARYQHTSTVLKNGLVLVVGGNATGSTLSTAELYDPGSGLWWRTGSMVHPRRSHTATLLRDGSVLVAGGTDLSNGPTGTAELYNPYSGLWSPTGTMFLARFNHSAVLLPSGKVLVTGGNNEVTDLNTAELYDPATGFWSTAASMPGPDRRSGHVSYVLPDGDVVVMGGQGNNPTAILIYYPAWDAWDSFGTLDASHLDTAGVLLSDGRAFLAGGKDAVVIGTTDIVSKILGNSPGWSPVLNSISTPLTSPAGLTASGSQFRGISEASGGNGAGSSPTNYPLFQIRSAEGGRVDWMLADAATGWSSTSFTTQSLSDLPSGYSIVTAFTNGIPSSPLPLRVARAASTLSLSANPNPCCSGDQVTLTATIIPSSASGYISFYDNGLLLGSAALSSGTASLTLSLSGNGSHALAALYTGDSLYSVSNSSAFIQLVSDGDAFESDDSQFTAMPITGGQTQNRNFCDDASDWIKFNACSGRTYTLQTSNLGSSADTRLELYMPDGSTLISSDDNGGGGLASKIVWTPSAEGEYYARVVQVDATTGASHSYDLSLTGDTTACQTWARTYGGSSTESPFAVLSAVDGNFVVGGYSLSFGAGIQNAWLIKVDPSGTPLWQYTYGSTGMATVINNVQETSTGGYAAAGSISSNANDFWVLNLNSAGNVIWQKSLGGAGSDNATALQQTSDEGFVITGYENSSGAGNYDAWIVKLDSSGNLQWQKTVGGSNIDIAAAIQSTSDGGSIVGGYTQSFGAGGWDAWLIHLDSLGNVVWQKTYGTGGTDQVFSIRQTAAGDYVVAGVLNGSAMLMKVDSSGNVLWTKTYSIDSIVDVHFTTNGEMIATGYNSGAVWLVRTNDAGTILWQHDFGGTGQDIGRGVKQIADGGYIVTAQTNHGAGSADIWLLRLDANGDVPGTCVEEFSGSVTTQTPTPTVNTVGAAATNSGNGIVATFLLPLASSVTPGTQCSYSVPLEVSRPASVDKLLFASDKTTMSWESASSNGAASFNVYRASITDLPSENNGTCLESGVGTNSYSTSATPPTGSCWFYVVTGKNTLGEGPMGNRSDGTPRSNENPCP